MRLLGAKKPSMAALGDDFVRARESRKLAIADVARQLHIRSEFIEAIENEHWEAIGDLVSLRGLLRTYARFLGLDGGAMVHRFNQDYAPALVSTQAVAVPRKFDMKAIGAVVLGVAAIVVVFFSLTQFVVRVRLHRHILATAQPQVTAAANTSVNSVATAAAAPTPSPSSESSPRARKSEK